MISREAVRLALASHEPADGTEAGHQAAMLEHLHHAAPFARTSFDPGHFTASAFVTRRTTSAHEVLLIFHGKLLRWLQPGGHVDPEDASLGAAARREVVEETGLGPSALDGEAVLLDLDVHVIPARAAEPRHLHLDVRFWLRARPDATPRAGSDARDARWATIEAVLADGFDTDASVRRALHTILRRA